MSKTIIKNHQYGLDIEEDKKALYGDQVEELEEIRFSLWSRLNHSHKNFKVLKYIIQNPVPITVEQFNILCGIPPSSIGGGWITSFLFGLNT